MKQTVIGSLAECMIPYFGDDVTQDDHYCSRSRLKSHTSRLSTLLWLECTCDFHYDFPFGDYISNML